jgi:L-amino acid N-acyltransferase YncA
VSVTGHVEETLVVRAATAADAAAIAGIYDHYVRYSVVTFEEAPVTAEQMAERMDAVIPRLPWLVGEAAGRIAGYAYAAPWKLRSAYRFTVETTIYLDTGSTGRGHGGTLYRALLQALRADGLHSAIGIIALPNPASVALHERLGFRQVGQLRDVGRKFDAWIDVGYWQVIL